MLFTNSHQIMTKTTDTTSVSRLPSLPDLPSYLNQNQQTKMPLSCPLS